MKKISCIIPAYNEEKYLKNTIEAVIPHLGTLLHEVIVINDASRDSTEKIIEKFPKIHYIKNEKNLGKSKSVAKAIKASSGDYIFLLDADLKGLTESHIQEFLQAGMVEGVEVVMTLLDNSWPLFPFTKIDYCTGQRVLQKKYFLELLPAIMRAQSYELEVITNNLIVEKQLPLKVVKWRGVANREHKNEKGLFAGWKKNLSIWRDILSGAGGIKNIYRMNWELQKLLKK